VTKRTVARAFLALVFVAAATAGWLSHRLTTARPLPATPYEFAVEPGSSLRAIANQLTHAGVLPDPWTFILLGRLLGRAGQLKAGHYMFQDAISPADVLDRLTEGSVIQAEVQFIEGWTLKQVRKALASHPDLKQETVSLSDAELATAVGAPYPSLEGIIFPDKYYFAVGASDLSVLKRGYHAMQQELDAAWERRTSGLPLATPYEALILASIVEKETGAEAERAMVAAVFVNRLKRGMKLDTDPTVIYGLGDRFDGNLRRRDLEADTPYNTYTRAGLPPTPISIPGRASLDAALNPADTKALYFVARGDGTSQFSVTLSEHERAVTKYQRRK
jgi:UPF0755 protein